MLLLYMASLSNPNDLYNETLQQNIKSIDLNQLETRI